MDLGRYESAGQVLEAAYRIRVKVGQKADKNYIVPRLKLAIAQSDAGQARRLIEDYYGPIPDSAPISIRLLQNMQAHAELALLTNDGKMAASIGHRLNETIRSSHLEIYLRL